MCVEVVVAALAFAPGPSRAQPSQGSDECPASTPTFRVGHRIENLDVVGTLGETRKIQVHLWYPARDHDDCDEAADSAPGFGGCHAPAAVYTSRLNGVPLLSTWSPLSWTIAGDAFEDARAAVGDERFPVIVFSHGSGVNAIDYAYTLEALASYGYVVAAPDHVNNTQDDARIDVVNKAGQAAISCFDGLPSPCSHASVADNMIDRYFDVEAVLKALPTWFGHRVDMDRIGIMGHSRGTVTALSLAGGSSGIHRIDSIPAPILSWGQQLHDPTLELPADSRVKAVMGMAIGVPSIAFAANVPDVTVPVLLVGGTLDVTSPLAVSQLAIQLVAHGDPNADKQLVRVPDAVHRHFESACCAELQSSGAIAQGDSRAALDRETARQIMQPPSLAHPGSGVAMDICGFDAFTTPTDVRPLVEAITGFTVIPFEGTPVTPTATSALWAAPTHGLTSDVVNDQMVRLAASFFGRVLNRADDDHRPFRDCLPDEFKNQPPVPEPTPQDLDEAEQHAGDPD